MDDRIEAELRIILDEVRQWRLPTHFAVERIEKLLKGGAPTTPPDTGTTLPRPRARFWRRGLGRVVG